MKLTKRKQTKSTEPIADKDAKKVCYVCKKIIKAYQEFYAIGKGKDGMEWYRHRRCNPRNYKKDEK